MRRWLVVEGRPTSKGNGYIRHEPMLRLTLLAPDIVEAILDGRQPEGMRLEDILERCSVEWGASGCSLDSQLEALGPAMSPFR